MKYIKIMLWVGLPASTFYVLWFLGVNTLGENPFYSFGQKLIIIPQLIVTSVAIFVFRKYYNHGVLSFAEGVWLGFWVTFISASLSSFSIFIYLKWFDPHLVDFQINELKGYLLANKDQLIRNSDMATYEANFNATNEISAATLMLDDFIWKMIKGLMFSFLASIALRRSHN